MNTWVRNAVLGGGLGLILTIVFTLQWMFAQERTAVEASVATSRELAVTIAERSYRNFLQEDARMAVDAALALKTNPLMEAHGIWAWEDQQPVFPPPLEFLPVNGSPIVDRIRALGFSPCGASRSDTEAQEFLCRLATAQSPEEITAVYRELLGYRANTRMAFSKEVSLRVAALDWLASNAEPDADLVNLELIDGFASSNGESIPGLALHLLRSTSRMTEADFSWLSHWLIQLAAKYGVSTSPFENVLERMLGDRPPPPTEPHLLLAANTQNASWSQGSLSVRFPVSHEELKARTLADIRLLGVQRLDVEPGPGTRLIVTVQSETWENLLAQARSRYVYKSLLNLLCLTLAMGVTAAVVWVDRRRQRFLDLQTDFLGVVSHELKTPLTSIRLQAESLQRRLVSDERGLQRYPERIIRDSDGLADLVENVLSYQRLRRTRLELRKEWVRLSSLLDQARTAAVHQENERVIVVETGETEILADSELVAIVFTNLLRNGLRYNSSSQPTVTVKVSGDSITVSDNGDGIRAELRERVFDAFERDRSAHARGTGLGLSICRQIVRQHGGDVVLEDSGTSGSTFRVILPAHDIRGAHG